MSLTESINADCQLSKTRENKQLIQDLEKPEFCQLFFACSSKETKDDIQCMEHFTSRHENVWMTTRGFRTKNTAELLQAVYFMYRCS
jgi:hypothetical protein